MNKLRENKLNESKLMNHQLHNNEVEGLASGGGGGGRARYKDKDIQKLELLITLMKLNRTFFKNGRIKN